MNKATLALVGSALMGLGMSAVADEPMMTHEQMMMMKTQSMTKDAPTQ